MIMILCCVNFANVTLDCFSLLALLLYMPKSVNDYSTETFFLYRSTMFLMQSFSVPSCFQCVDVVAALKKTVYMCIFQFSVHKRFFSYSEHQYRSRTTC